MIPRKLANASDEKIRTAAKQFRQGHLIELPPLFYGANLEAPVWDLATAVASEGFDDPFAVVEIHDDDRPPYGIITTQSCDIWRVDQQPWLQISPVFPLEDDEILSAGEFIVELDPPDVDGRWYADLRLEMPLEKGMLLGRSPIESWPDEDRSLRFADVLARRRGRPALHSVFHVILNEVMGSMKRESNAMRKKLRRVRKRVYGVRLAIEDGTRIEPVAAKLYVLTKGDPGAEENAEVHEWFEAWWDIASAKAEEEGLRLLPTGWMDSANVDLELYDDLVDVEARELAR